MTLDMTPWVDTNFNAAWERIAQVVPASWMPQRMQTPHLAHRDRPDVLREFACGSYGCVLPTNEPGLVIKITSDISEAHFVQMAMGIETSDVMKREMGLVNYRKILKLEGQTYKRRPLFVLWRDEAFDIGLLSDLMGRASNSFGYDDYQKREILKGVSLISKFLSAAREVRDPVKATLNRHRSIEARTEFLTRLWTAYEQSEPRTTERPGNMNYYGATLRTCLSIAQEIGKLDAIYPIGTTLAYYLEEGILLADVHLGNIGRDSEEKMVITDPGHAVEFSPRWAQLPGIQVV